MADARVIVGEGKGLTLPVWFLSGCLVAFFATSIPVAASMIHTYSTTDQNSKDIESNKQAIVQLQQSMVQLGALQQAVKDQSDKIDLILSLQRQQEKQDGK